MAPSPTISPKKPTVSVVPAAIKLSIFDNDIDLSDKIGPRLYSIGSEPLPTKFTGGGKDLRIFVSALESRAKKCRWGPTILTFQTPDGTTVNLLQDYGRITMEALRIARDIRRTIPVTTLTLARPQIDSSMMFECIESSLDEKVHKKLLLKAKDIDYDGPMLFKQIIEDTFVTTTATTFNTKTNLFSMDLKDYKHNIVEFHEDVTNKVASLQAVGHSHSDTDLCVGLFKAYATSENAIFKNHIEFLKSEYNEARITSGEALMHKVEAKYDDMLKHKQWKNVKAEDDKNVIALQATLKSLTEVLKERPKPNPEGYKKQEGKNSWKFDPSLGTNGSYTRKTGDKEKTYRWCTGPGHGGKPMWVIHEPGTCTSEGKPARVPETPGNSGTGNPTQQDPEAAIQALKAVLENNAFGDDNNAQLSAILAVLKL
jgi:hypothetical protein